MTKNALLSITTGIAALFTALLVACDWSGGGGDNNFNTSGLSSISNISGHYQGVSGRKAVSNPSRGNITSMTIQQSGNRVEVVDNQGSTYTGVVGAPLLVSPPDMDQIPAGAQVASYQIGFSGKDGVAARNIEFSGVITLVAVTDISGEFRETERTTISGSASEDGLSSSTRVEEQSQFREFELTDANTQLRMRGTWVEEGGNVSTVDALAAGVIGNITSAPSAPGGGGGGGTGGGGTGL